MQKLAGALSSAFLMTLAASAAWAQPFVYVADADSDSVTVIDAATNTVETTIMVGDEPRNPAVSPDGTRVVVPIRHDDEVTVINGVTNTIITTIMSADFDEPYSAAVSPNGTRAYVANKEGGGSSSGSLSVIDLTDNTVITTIEDACFVSPEWVELNPAGTRAYVVNRQGDSVCVVNTATNMVIDEVTGLSAPRSAVVTCNGAFVYVANEGDGTVSKIQTSDNTIIDSFDFTGSPRNMAIAPDCSKIYVPLQNATVGVITLPGDTLTTITLMGGDSTYGAAFLANGAFAYITDEDDNEVEVIDVATDTQVTGMDLPIPAGSTPRGIAAARGQAQAFVAAPVASPAGLAALVATLFALAGRRYRRAS